MGVVIKIVLFISLKGSLFLPFHERAIIHFVVEYITKLTYLSILKVHVFLIGRLLRPRKVFKIMETKLIFQLGFLL